MKVWFCFLVFWLSSVTFAADPNATQLISNLKSALEVKSWHYTNKNENQKLKSLKDAKIKSVPAAVKKRFQIQNDKLDQITAYFELLKSSDKEQIEKIKSLKAKLQPGKSQPEMISEINQVIDSLIEKTFSNGTPESAPENNLVSQILHPGTFSFDEGAFASIRILNGLEVGVHEVTQQEWFDVMGYNPSFFSSEEFCTSNFKKAGVTGLCPLLPVENFDYAQILNFLLKLNSVDSRYHYRLLTKKEFMLIAKFIMPSDKDLDQFSWHYGNAKGQTQAVGTKQKDKLGLYDILGNLYELVDAGTDFEKINSGTKIESFGGSWLTRRYSIMPETYWTIGKDYTCFDVGFRLVREKKSKTEK